MRNPEMKRAEVFPSKWLKGVEIEGLEVKVIIDRVEMQEIQEGEPLKACMFFLGKEKGIVLNATNWDRCEYAFGPESDDWCGKPLTLYTEEIRFQGKVGPSIRVRPPAKKQPPKRAESENPAPVDYKADLDDEIPF
jgi:hypothetical protein